MGEVTRDGQLKGKLAYMAPEQVRGTTDRTTDVYAASVVLWEALTGKRLFKGASDMEVFAKVMEGNVVPPSTVVPGLPTILDEVTLRGLHRDPTQRYPTAREMARALEETMPLVAASRIGEWVERAAGAVLDDRARRMEAIESDSAMRVPQMPDGFPGRLSDPGASAAMGQVPLAVSSAPSLLSNPSVHSATVTLPDEAPATQLSGVSTPDLPSALDPARRLRMGVLIAAPIGLLLGLVGIFQIRSAPDDSATSQASAPTPFSEPSAKPVPPAPVADPAPPPVAAAPASSASSAPPPIRAVPPVVGRPPVIGQPPARWTPPPKAHPKDDPYDHL